MNVIKNLKISVKLTGSFMIVGLIIAIVAVVGYVNMQSIDNNLVSMYNNSLKPIDQLDLAYAYMYQARGDVYKYILLPDQQQATRTALAADIQNATAQMDLFRAGQLDPQETELVKQFDQDWAGYQAAVDKIKGTVDSGDTKAALAMLLDSGDAATMRKAVGDELFKLITINKDQATTDENQGALAFENSTRVLIGVMITGMLLAVGLGLVISQSLAKPAKLLAGKADEIDKKDLVNYATAADAMASGDLTVKFRVQTEPLTYQSKDEMGDLANSFNAMIAHLQETGQSLDQMRRSLVEQLGRVADNANNLQGTSKGLALASEQAAQATGQISTTVQQVAQGITQQTTSISKTAGSVEQMGHAIDGVAKGAQEQSNAVAKASATTTQITSAIQQVAANAQTIADGASQAADTTREGANTVKETIKGMQAIKAKVGLSVEKVQEMGSRSGQIGAIVETIDDIASQTNLLALNAAIEAARAGEHGKGFAVVADEVRKLAERSSSATKEIGALIKAIQQTVAEAVGAMNESAKEVENGVQSANESDEALKDILQAVELVNRQVEEIAAAAQHISVSSNELVNAMDSVSAVVEENTASAEEMAANSSEVTSAVESIASVSEENSAAVEEVSASTEEMSAQVEEVTASAQSLAEMAQTLQQIVAQFKLDEEILRQERSASVTGVQTGTHPVKHTLQSSPQKVKGNGPNGGNGHHELAGQGARKA